MTPVRLAIGALFVATYADGALVGEVLEHHDGADVMRVRLFGSALPSSGHVCVVPTAFAARVIDRPAFEVACRRAA